MAIIGNGLAGVVGLLAWRNARLRGKHVWWAAIAAEIALLVQVVTGVIMVSGKKFQPPRFHMFYGFVAFITIGIAYSYRDSMRGRLEMLYGFVGLFLMGLAIRAILVVK